MISNNINVKIMKKIILLSILVCVSFSVCLAAKPNVWLIGDGSMATASESFVRGWGEALSEHLAKGVVLHNEAKNGMSLKSFVQRFGTSGGYVAFASMINSLGGVSTAAHTIANTVESAFYVPGYGMQSASATLSGNALGANDRDRIKQLSRMIIFIEAVLMIISGTFLFIFAPALVGIFSKDNEVISLGTTVLRMVALSEPFYGVSIVIEGMMQGMGKTKMPFVVNIITMWLVRILGTFILTQLFEYGLVSAWACMILHNLALFAVFMIYYLTGKYIPKKKKDTK